MTLLHLRGELRAIDRIVAASLVFGVDDVSLSIAARPVTPDTPVLTVQYLQGTADTVFPIGLKSWHSPHSSPPYADLAGLPSALFAAGKGPVGGQARSGPCQLLARRVTESQSANKTDLLKE